MALVPLIYIFHCDTDVLMFQCIYAEINFVNSLDGDPGNYLSYFKRAAVYLAMGKMKSAIPDLGEAIRLNPNFNTVCMFCSSH